MRAFESNGQAFEDFFTAIMTRRSKTFHQVKPQGTWGDRKNDGFDHTTGTYYQVFAPESSCAGDAYGADKLKEDFEGLIHHWNKENRIKQFFYVVNDKYKGVGPKIHQELESLRVGHPNITIGLLLCSSLCDEFLALGLDHQDDVLGGPMPQPNEEDVDQDALNAVICHMLRQNEARKFVPLPDNVDFERKIVFNRLSTEPSALLRSKSLDARVDITAYFKYRNKSEKQQLAEIFSATYAKGRTLFASEPAEDDLIFYYILNNVYRASTRQHQDAVLALMAFFFESCDIFEAPPPA